MPRVCTRWKSWLAGREVRCHDEGRPLRPVLGRRVRYRARMAVCQKASCGDYARREALTRVSVAAWFDRANRCGVSRIRTRLWNHRNVRDRRSAQRVGVAADSAANCFGFVNVLPDMQEEAASTLGAILHG